MFSSAGFMPHIHCYLNKPGLVWTMCITDLLIGIAYLGISITLWGLIRKIKIPFSFVVLCFGVFIGACGATHFMEVYNLWTPDYWAAAFVKILTAIASVGTGIYLYQLRQPLILVAEAAKLSEQRRLDLEVLTDTLENRVNDRTKALNSALKTRDDFLSVASHEFRTPITALKLKAELARRTWAKDPSESSQKFKKYTDEVDDQVTRLSKLVEDLLDVTRVRSGTLSLTPEEFNLTALLTDSLDKFQPTLSKHEIQLKPSIATNVIAWGDPLRFEQVFNNLISNAIRYAPGVPLEVSLSETPFGIEIVFQDDGKGIADDDLERIFNRFERLEPRTHVQGMGVGLYVTQAILAAHEGSIAAVKSQKGARFVIKLPLSQQVKSLDTVIPVSDNERT